MGRIVSILVTAFFIISCSCDPKKEVCGSAMSSGKDSNPETVSQNSVPGPEIPVGNAIQVSELVGNWEQLECEPVSSSSLYQKVSFSFSQTKIFNFRLSNYSDSSCTASTGGAVSLTVLPNYQVFDSFGSKMFFFTSNDPASSYPFQTYAGFYFQGSTLFIGEGTAKLSEAFSNLNKTKSFRKN